MKVSDFIAVWLAHKGINTVFELSGGMIVHLLDSFYQQGKIRVVNMYHEQGAAFAADAFGRMTGLPGVALATSGPGAINLLTGVGSCHFDSSPGLFITGQVNRLEQKGVRPVRQLGFQETDIISMVQPITKAAWRVQTAEEIPQLMERAFALATAGRPGPVLLDIPMDIQRSELSAPCAIAASSLAGAEADAAPDAVWTDLASRLERARRPLILAGGGLRSGRAVREFREFVARLGVPVVHSLMAADVLPFDHPLRVGMIGTYGNRYANFALGRSDFLLVLGSRLDVRQTGSQTEAFGAGRDIVHVDCDPAEINNRVSNCVPVVCELRSFLIRGLKQTLVWPAKAGGQWLSEIAGLRAQWPDERELRGIQGINPNSLMHAVSRASRRAAGYVVDVGQHQMWAAQSLEMQPEQRFLTSGGMGAMGFALPAAIGACFAAPGETFVVIAGDGGFQCNIQELQTVVHNRLPLKIVVLNNRCHGMVRQFQENYFESRYPNTVWGYSTPDFTKVAAAYGIEARRLEHQSDVQEAMNWLWQTREEPSLLEVSIDMHINAYPKVTFGGLITEMEPSVS